jgi:hypothetical protein
MHPFRLPGTVFYDCLQETIDVVVLLREKKEHKVLRLLEATLRSSVGDVVSIAKDIAQAEVWVKDITDILLGMPDQQGRRNTANYRKKMTSKKVKQKLLKYILNLAETKQTSLFLREVIKHFRIVHNNWNEYLFTCYDYQFLPNTNLELELSHSRMKRKHRRITGLKNSHQFLLRHGEHFAYCFNADYSYELFLSLLRSVDYEKVKTKTKEEAKKSKQRGKNRLTLKNLPKRLEEIVTGWIH